MPQVCKVVRKEEIDFSAYEPPQPCIALWERIFNEKLIEFEYLIRGWFCREEVDEEELDDFLRFEESYIRRELDLFD